MVLLTCVSCFPTHSQVGIVYDAGRFRRDPRQLEEDEEAWFDDEEETVAPTENLTSSPDMNRLPPITSTTPPTTHASSPFTLPSYSPRPAGALTRLPLMETKMPTISAVSNLVSYPDPLPHSKRVWERDYKQLCAHSDQFCRQVTLASPCSQALRVRCLQYGILRKYHTASDECAGPRNKANPF